MHTLAVGEAAARMLATSPEPPEWVDEVVATATLHDIGYFWSDTGHHGVDGGRFLGTVIGCAPRVCAQVAWHSSARFEVEARGLDVDLAEEFGEPDPLVHAIVWVADFTTSPTGEPIALRDRLDDIRSRYGPDSPVTEAVDACIPDLKAAVDLLSVTPGIALPAEATLRR